MTAAVAALAVVAAGKQPRASYTPEYVRQALCSKRVHRAALPVRFGHRLAPVVR